MIHPDDGNLAALRTHDEMLERAEARQELVDQEAQSLLKNECYPFNTDNLAEAMYEYIESRIDALAANMNEGKFTEIGKELTNHVFAYWMQKSDEKAERLID